jgi:hypothetical protein
VLFDLLPLLLDLYVPVFFFDPIVPDSFPLLLAPAFLFLSSGPVFLLEDDVVVGFFCLSTREFLFVGVEGAFFLAEALPLPL